MTEQSMDLQGDINLIISVPTMLLAALHGVTHGCRIDQWMEVEVPCSRLTICPLELASVALPQFFNHSQLSLPKIGVPNPAPGICCACLGKLQWKCRIGLATRRGRHVDVRLTAEDGHQTQRSYSIASPPEGYQLAWW